MTDYAAPLEQIRIALRVWSQLPELMAMQVPGSRDPDTVDAVLDEAARFATEVLAPLDAVGHRDGCERLADGHVRTPRGWKEAYQGFVAAGWNTVNFPVEIGGQGLPAPVAIAVAEMFDGANVAFALCLMPFAGVVALLERFGTPEQKARYLAPLVCGAWSATLAMTESRAGTDIGAVRTAAFEADDGAYTLRGEKVFISYGAHDLNDNIVHFVLARDPAGPAGVKGLSLYVVPKRRVGADGSLGPLNDVECIAVEKKLGIHGSPTTSLMFGAQGGAWGERLGAPCKGLEQMFVVLNRARLNIGVFGLGSAERAWQAANAYAHQRVQGVDVDGRPCVIARHPDVRRMLLDMQSGVDAMRAVCYHAAGILERSQREPDADRRELCRRRLDLLTPVVKGWTTEFAYETAGTGVQVAGGIGYMADSVAGRCLLEARVHTIYEGTTGIQAIDLAIRKVARDRGATALELVAEMRASWVGAAEAAGLGPLAAGIEEALDTLEAATGWIVERAASDGPAVQAVAVNYLTMWGICLGAWLLTGAARESSTLHDSARYFMRHRLPRVAALWRAMEFGADAVLSTPTTQTS